MFVKLVVLACSVAPSLAAYNGPLAGGLPAAQYPAGVSPQACPNFPLCTNPAVAANPSAPAPQVAPHYNQIPAYNQGAYNQGAYNQGPAAYNAGPAAYNQGQPQYNNGAYNPQQAALDKGEYIGDGDYRGEGLAESGAYGSADDHQSNPAPVAYNQGAYNQGSYNQGAYNQGAINQGAYNPSPYTGARAYNHGTYHSAPASHGQVPAGVDPASCPNYPYCS